MKYIFLVAIAVTFLTSCKSLKSNAQSSSKLFIEENIWEMTSYKGMLPQEAGFKLKTPHLVINMEKGAIGGNSGCNSFGGDLKVEEGILQIGPTFGTKMYCDGVPETEFFQLLDGKIEYSFKNDLLSLSKDGKEIMTFTLKSKDQ